jgi:hypothetical protein
MKLKQLPSGYATSYFRAADNLSWYGETAISLPWSLFCEFWDDFCYPSSDDADTFLENGQYFLR